MTRARVSAAGRQPIRRNPPAVSDPEPFVPPDRPSWFDRLTAAIDRLPAPYWAPYWLAFVLWLGLIVMVLSRAGAPLTLALVYAHSLPFYGFWLLHYLDRRAAASLEDFRPAYTGVEAQLQEVRWRLTNLPATPALAVTLAAMLLASLGSLSWGMDTLFQVLDRLGFLATLVFAFLYAYHSVRQLRLVTWLYAERAQVNLHHLIPLRSFSTLTAHTAIGMLLVLSGAAIFTPEGLVGYWLVAALLFAGFAVLTFILPLAGLNRRLAGAKAQELAENARRWEAVMAELYRLIDRGDLPAADRLNGTLAALERGRIAIERIPTWPWRPETLRGMIGALVLPVLIFLAQRLLGSLLG
jgi:hypothetical protein